MVVAITNDDSIRSCLDRWMLNDFLQNDHDLAREQKLNAHIRALYDKLLSGQAYKDFNIFCDQVVGMEDHRRIFLPSQFLELLILGLRYTYFNFWNINDIKLDKIYRSEGDFSRKFNKQMYLSRFVGQVCRFFEASL